MMNTLKPFSGGVLAAGVTLCAVPQVALAQQSSPLQVSYQAQKLDMFRQGQNSVYVLQGDVKLISTGVGALNLTTTPDAFIYTAPGKAGMIARIPMDMATLQVCVTPAGTIFTDKEGDKLTLQTSQQPSGPGVRP
jgi:hypothetical protein